MLLYHKLPTQLWQLSVSFLDIPSIVRQVAMLSKFFRGEVVWPDGPMTRAVYLWMETQIDDIVFGKHDDWTYGFSVLQYACLRVAPMNTIKVLIRSGANVTLRDAWRKTVLHYMIELSMDSQLVSHVIVIGGPECVNDVNEKGFTPLMLACQRHFFDKDVLRLLLSMCTPKTIDHVGRGCMYTALMYAMFRGHTDIVRMLLDAKANVHVRDYGEHKTVLQFCSYYTQNATIVTMLEEAARQQTRCNLSNK